MGEVGIQEELDLIDGTRAHTHTHTHTHTHIQTHTHTCTHTRQELIYSNLI